MILLLLYTSSALMPEGANVNGPEYPAADRCSSALIASQDSFCSC